MNAAALLEKLDNLGIKVTASDDQLRLEPGSRVPPELVEELKAHKQEVLLFLKGYRFEYPGKQATERELSELAARVRKEGYVLLWSHILEDLIAFYRTEEDRKNVPPGFVPYSEAELWQLFGQGKPQKTPQTLRLIHETKKLGGRVSISQTLDKMSNDNPGP